MNSRPRLKYAYYCGDKVLIPPNTNNTNGTIPPKNNTNGTKPTFGLSGLSFSGIIIATTVVISFFIWEFSINYTQWKIC